MQENHKNTCVLCQKADSELPLIQLSYNGKAYYVCPEHMPTLIHQPDALIGKMPGAENMNAG